MGCGTSKWDSARGRSAGPGTGSVVKRASSAPAVAIGVESGDGISDEVHTITRATSNPEAPTRVASVDSIQIASDELVTVDAAAVGTES